MKALFPMNARLAIGCSLILLSPACIIAEGAEPGVLLRVNAATDFVHRGMTLVDRPVVQPTLGMELETADGGTLGVRAEGNIDLKNNTGRAWFPNGHAGRFTQIEFMVDYSRSVDIGLESPLVVRTGVHSYNLPNGTEFPNGERGATTEVFGQLSLEVLGATPYLAHHYDFDEVRSSYLRAGVTEDFPLGDDWTLVLDGSLGYNGSAQSSWMYGIDESGMSDLRGSVTIVYAYDDRTDVEVGVHGSTMVDSTLNEWFAALDIPDDVIWANAGVSWSF